MALEYVNTFLNGSDEEAKTKFVNEHVYPDAQVLFQIIQSVESLAFYVKAGCIFPL